jgi:GNAT superfamily N-acetyltransferase
MRRARVGGHPQDMQSEFVGGVTIRALRNGDAATVQAVFDGLGGRSRLRRFGGVKNVLSRSDLELLARVDATHHVLVAWAENLPIGIARLVRDGDGCEVAFEVVDAWQGRGVGTMLVERLAADARAAGIRRFRADVDPGNVASLALLRRARFAAAA